MAASTVDLRVLSPSIELDGGIRFENLPVSATIGELKIKIKDELPSHPSPERMRIIYLGRMMLDSTTLQDVFGQEAIQQSKTHNLHMVLRDVPSDPTPRVSSAPPSALRPAQTTFLQSGQVAAPPRPQSQPRNPSTIPQAPPLANPVANAQGLPNMGLPPQVGHLINQQLNAQFLQAVQQHQFPPNPGAPQAIPSVTQEHVGPNGERVRFNLSGGVAAAPPQRFQNLPGVPPMADQIIRGLPVNPQAGLFPAHHAQIPHLDPGNTNRPPNLNPAVMQMQRNPALMHPQALRMAGQDIASGNRAMDVIRGNLQAANNEVNTITDLMAGHMDSSAEVEASSQPPVNYIQALHHFERLNSHLDQTTALADALNANPHFAGNQQLLGLRIDRAMMQTATRNAIRGLSNHITARRIHAQNANRNEAANGPADPNAPGIASGNAPDPVPREIPGQFTIAPNIGPIESQMVPTSYLLRSPNGAQTLLLSRDGARQTIGPPLGIYTEDPWTFNLYYQRLLADLGRSLNNSANPTNTPPFPPPSLTNSSSNTANAPAPIPEGPAVPPARQPAAAPAAIAPRQPAAAAAAPGQQAQQGGMVVAAGHIWILVRIIGFIYIFGGSTWRRTLVLALIGFVFYVVQTGLLGTGWLGQHWDRLRRHFEQLVGIPERLPLGQAQGLGQGDAPAPAPAPHGNGGAADGAAVAQQQPGQPPRRRGEPDPAVVAQRLLAEREANQRTWLADVVRAVERVLALFVASLWPGLGERMVAAREEADAQARRELQDREEAERREREERERAEAEQVGVEGTEGGGNGNAGTEVEAGEGQGVVEADTNEKGKGKGKERAEDVGEGSSSSSAAAAASGAAVGDAYANANTETAPPRQREGWTFGDAE